MPKMPIKWIWEHSNFGEFPYDIDRITPLLSKIEYSKGKLDAMLSFFDADTLDNIEVHNIVREIMDTSKIEGEYLLRESVRDSVAKRIDGQYDAKRDNSTRQTDAMADLIIDSRLNNADLSVERLHGWHNAILGHGYGNSTKKIDIAKFREYDDMKVVEGAIGHEVTKYLAPPQDMMYTQIDRLMDYCNSSTENPYVKSAIAHLWFVAIHPYDDGNGRISRAIADYVLSHDSNEQFKAYSISTAIYRDRVGYYDILDNTTNLHKNRDFDFTHWINWHTQILGNAMEKSLEDIHFIIKKTKFWDRHRSKALNKRQIQILEYLLDSNEAKTISTKQYIEMTESSKTTTSRDIKELVTLECIEQVENTAGRNVKYRVVFVNERTLKERYDGV